MKLPLEKLQVSEIIRKAVSELNKVVDDAESLGLKVDFLSRNRHSLNPDVEPRATALKLFSTSLDNLPKKLWISVGFQSFVSY